MLKKLSLIGNQLTRVSTDSSMFLDKSSINQLKYVSGQVEYNSIFECFVKRCQVSKLLPATCFRCIIGRYECQPTRVPTDSSTGKTAVGQLE